MTTTEKDLNIFILFPDEEIDKIIQEFRGVKYDVNSGQWIKVSEPLMSEEGINTFKLVLKSILNPNTFMTNIETNSEVKLLAREFLINILKELMKNKEKYKISNENITMIMTILIPFVVLGLKRAYKQGEREFHKTTTTTRREITPIRQESIETIPVTNKPEI